MLKLTRRDLGTPALPGMKPGVVAWWPKVPNRKRPVLAIAWDDLVLIRPSLEWPADFFGRQQPGWERDPLRVTWVRDLGAYAVSDRVPAPDLSDLLELPRQDSRPIYLVREPLRVRVRGLRHPCKLRVLLRAPLPDVYLTKESVERVRRGLDLGREVDVNLRLHEREDGSLVALAYRGGLRAIASAVSP